MTKPPISSMEAPQPRCPEDDAPTRQLPSHGYHNYYGSMNHRTTSTVGPNENPSGARNNNNTTTGAPRQSSSPRDDKSRERSGEKCRSSPCGFGIERQGHARLAGRVTFIAAVMTMLMMLVLWMTLIREPHQVLWPQPGSTTTTLMTMVQSRHRSKNNNNNNETTPANHATRQKQCVFTNVVCRTGENECYLRPSEYETCLQTIRLHPAHVQQTIQSLDDIFAQYYPFYYLAQHPAVNSNNTDPGLPRNARVYHRQYDLHAQLQRLRQSVAEQGTSSVAIFWNVTASFNLLRDAHVRAVQGRIGQLASEFWSGRYALVVLPSSTLLSSSRNSTTTNNELLLQTDFYLCNGTCRDGSASTVGLDLWRYHRAPKNGTEESDVLRLDAVQHVTRVEGKTPWDFVVRMARHAPLASITFKSVGPRVNSLLARNFATSEPVPTFFRTRPGRKERIWPSDILPHDSFDVEYHEGSKGRTAREKFDVRIAVAPSDCREIQDLLRRAPNPSAERLVVDITDIEKAANEPSCLYRNHETAMRKFRKINDTAKNVVRRRILSQNVPQSVRPHPESNSQSKDILDEYCTCRQDGWFTKQYNCSNFAAPYDGDGPFEVAYKVMDDFMVLQLDSFDAPPTIIFPLWSEITQAARRAGVDKLMIDLSNNGGGEVPMGLNLARLLYPEVACEFFDNAYDMVYNPTMRVWAQEVDPLLRRIESDWLHSGDVTMGDEVLLSAFVGDGNVRQRQRIVDMAEAMCILAVDRTDTYCGADPIARVRSNCTLYLAAVAFDRNPNQSTLNPFLREYLAAMRSGNPWTVAAKFDVSDDIAEETYQRGGVLDNFTGFLRHEPDLPVWWNCSLEAVRDDENVFSQYVLVSNGNAGSTTNTFQTTVEQLWKNRNLTQARRPLTTVSYGGIEGDTPLTQFAGGTLDDRVNVQDAFAGLVGLHLLQVVCPLVRNVSTCAQVHDAFTVLSETLPQVPFHLEKFPALPAGIFLPRRSQQPAIPKSFVFLTLSIFSLIRM